MAEIEIDRREWLKVAGLLGLSAGLAGVGCAPANSGQPTTTWPTTTVPPPQPIGPLQAVNADGLMIPAGFTSRIVATVGQQIGSTGYVLPANPDGAATFPKQGGGWVLMLNHETATPDGGVSRIVFDAVGTVVQAERSLNGTHRNCAGGASLWGTWLSCEEYAEGLVWECDPLGVDPSVSRPAMGAFSHEAVAYHPATDTLFLTEDQPDSGLYRFTPTTHGDLSAGALDVLCESAGVLSWLPVNDPAGTVTETRYQQATKKTFAGGEGICHFGGNIYFTTKYDNKVWRYSPGTNQLDVIYTAPTSGAVLKGVDNIVSNAAGDLFVAEDGDNMQVVMLRDGTPQAVVQVVGVSGSEITGPTFSPNGQRLYFSSQRNPGKLYEVAGPWV